MKNIKLIFIDDEEDFRTPIAAILRHNGYEVEEAGTPDEMADILSNYNPDIFLLDINLPQESGLDIARRLKQQSSASIIMLTAYGSVEDRIEGLTTGADYYLPKPVDTRELMAVIENLYLRYHQAGKITANWQLDTTSWSLTTPDNRQHPLNKAELVILSTLAQSKGDPVTRAQLYKALGVHTYTAETRSLDIQISRLRKRFSSDRYCIPIKTVHSVGYLFNDTISVES